MIVWLKLVYNLVNWIVFTNFLFDTKNYYFLLTNLILRNVYFQFDIYLIVTILTVKTNCPDLRLFYLKINFRISLFIIISGFLCWRYTKQLFQRSWSLSLVMIVIVIFEWLCHIINLLFHNSLNCDILLVSFPYQFQL